MTATIIRAAATTSRKTQGLRLLAWLRAPVVMMSALGVAMAVLFIWLRR